MDVVIEVYQGSDQGCQERDISREGRVIVPKGNDMTDRQLCQQIYCQISLVPSVSLCVCHFFHNFCSDFQESFNI